MNWILYAILILFVVGVRPCLKAENEDYISKNAIQPVKGLFILLVFASHFIQYIHPDAAIDGSYLAVRRYLGQMIVVPFLFYSGYGVSESIRRKGQDYLKAFPLKRVLGVVFQFAVAVAIYIIYRSCFMDASFPLKRTLLCLIGWNSAGNSNWYIFSIVILYMLTWVSHWAFGEKEHSPLPDVVLTALTLLAVNILSRCRPDYVYNTLFAYVFGCWFSRYRPHFDRLFANFRSYAVALIALIVAYSMLRLEWASTTICETAAIVFAMIVVLITKRVRFQSPVFAYCGTHLFSLYVLQRLPMLALKGTALAGNRYLYFATCLAITFVISWLFDQTVPRLWGMLTGKHSGAARR